MKNTKYKVGDIVVPRSFYRGVFNEHGTGRIISMIVDWRGTVCTIKFENKITEYNVNNIELVSSSKKGLPSWF